MPHILNQELVYFETAIKALPSTIEVQALCPFAYRLVPGELRNWAWNGKRTGLTLAGITHGNEVAGLGAINDLLTALVHGTVILRFPLALMLGNIPAAQANKRFTERDLNRCFGGDGTGSHEQRRAKELEGVLRETHWFIDIHQVNAKSEHPFFIFPFTRSGFNFARKLAPQLPVVTHWGKGFSAEGMCTDEFVNRNGGIGISVELGKAGFDPYQIGIGMQLSIAALNFVETQIGAGKREIPRAIEPAPLYTFGDIVPYPATGKVELHPGWFNFQTIEQGQILGTHDGKNIVAPISGKMLFPKYVTNLNDPRPTELCRILKVITEQDLPGA